MESGDNDVTAAMNPALDSHMANDPPISSATGKDTQKPMQIGHSMPWLIHPDVKRFWTRFRNFVNRPAGPSVFAMENARPNEISHAMR